MARKKINRELALKAFVQTLSEKFGEKTVFTRKQVEEAGNGNVLGRILFGSKKEGYGNLTGRGWGLYAIPEEWLKGKAPWEGVVEPEITVKQPKQTTKKSKHVEVSEAVVNNTKANIKRVLTKKELFEKAKAELAKRAAEV